MIETLSNRQKTSECVEKLNRMGKIKKPGSGRRIIDGNRDHTSLVITASDLQRLELYAERRYTSVARIMLLLSLLREHEWERLSRPVTVEPRGAYWQGFQGTRQENACHTCPSLLLLNGQIPTLATTNMGLRRHLIVEFSDCMMMPRRINNLDKIVDDRIGRHAFTRAAAQVLNNRNMDWLAGTEAFTDEMGQVFSAITPEKMNTLIKYRADDDTALSKLDVAMAYYQSLYYTHPSRLKMETFRAQVEAEMGLNQKTNMA